MEWFLGFLIVLFAALIQTCTGFGFAIIAIPLLILLFPVHDAITLSVFLSLISASSTWMRVRKEVNKEILKRLFKGSLIGLPLGGLIFYLADVKWLSLIVSIAILVSAVAMMIRITLPLGEGRRIGFLSGLLTASIGMPGPPVILFLISKNLDKQAFRGTAIAFYSLIYPITLGLQWLSGRFEVNWLGALAMIPAIFAGQAVGSLLHRRISQSWFRRVTFLLLLATAVNSLLESFQA